jgi:SAM-dependent methyltransferase
MHRPGRAPNRLLELDDLETPEFREVLDSLDRLTAADDVSYLHPGKRWEYPWALERAGLAPGSTVLDVGCGDSIFPVYLAAQGHRVVAVDLDFTTNIGHLHGLRTGYLRGDLGALPLADGAFDVVFCISVIEHLPEHGVAAALAEIRRVLRPGGRLLLTTDYYEDCRASLWYSGPDLDPFPVDWGIFDEERLRRLVLAAPGFRLDGELDLRADWDRIRPRMRAYHGYPYTSVGVSLLRA